jgi:phenylacetate-CoA ligase
VAFALRNLQDACVSLYTQLVSGALFPLHERLKGHSTVAVLRGMERSQWLSAREMERLRIARLREFLARIGTHVPYYRELFGTLGFDPAVLMSVGDLQCLPLTGKADIRANTDRLKAENGGKLERFTTGGSSGEPLIFYRGKERVSHDVAAKWRATRWWRVDIGDPEIVVWGSPIELGSQDRIRLVRDRLLRTELLSAFEMSETNLQKFIKRIMAYRPRMLFGYPSSLALLADYSRQYGYRVDNLGIKVIFVTSESLYDYQRQAIEAVFGAPVANGYGGRDAGFIAHECPHRSMHITAEDIIVEIVDAQGKAVPIGEKGEIVVTHMSTADFPFVRYRTGDVGRLSSESCTCGRGLPVLAEIEGRSTDFVIAADGTVLHGLALIYVLRELPEVEEFKIIQETLSTITVQIVTATRDTTKLEGMVTEQFRRRLGDSLIVNFVYADKIEREESGKFRYVVSKITNQM